MGPGERLFGPSCSGAGEGITGSQTTATEALRGVVGKQHGSGDAGPRVRYDEHSTLKRSAYRRLA